MRRRKTIFTRPKAVVSKYRDAERRRQRREKSLEEYAAKKETEKDQKEPPLRKVIRKEKEERKAESDKQYHREQEKQWTKYEDDHFRPPLLEIPPKAPIISAKEALAMVKKMK